MDARRLACLEAMGIPAWSRRPAPESEETIRLLDWESLEARVGACTRCPLHAGRTRIVFGVGDRRADWLIVGEAPGAEEDQRGEPFVGRAGKLLDAMLLAVGLARRQVYIANVVKCRPPENRDPRPEEAASCAPFLERQIELLRPKVMLAVGKVAAQRLLGVDAPVGQLRGRIHRYGPAGIPLVVTWHPAYLLRRPEAKAGAWRDLVLAVSAVGGESPSGEE
jgi:uracil-DNA glycosylase